MKKRSLRRHHSERMKKKAELIVKGWYTFYEGDIKEEASRYHNHLKICSCQMCRNPRHSNWTKTKETFQEIRSEISFKEWEKGL